MHHSFFNSLSDQPRGQTCEKGARPSKETRRKTDVRLEQDGQINAGNKGKGLRGEGQCITKLNGIDGTTGSSGESKCLCYAAMCSLAGLTTLS